MPTYEYECAHCGYNFEVFQKITEAPLSKCPKCKRKIRRLIGSGSGIIFKGAGFYATDYRKKAPSSSSSAPEKTCPEIQKGCRGCQPA